MYRTYIYNALICMQQHLSKNVYWSITFCQNFVLSFIESNEVKWKIAEAGAEEKIPSL